MKAERELVQVGLQVLGLDSVVCAAQPRLEVAEDPMHAREDDRGAFRASLGLGPVAVAHGGQRGVALPAVGDHDRAGLHARFDEPAEGGGRRIGNYPEPDPTRGTASDLDGTHDECPVAQFAPTAKSFLVADVRLIGFHLVPQGLSLGSEHGAAQFVEHRPRRFVPADAELTLQLKRGHPRRVRGHQVRRPEPLPERRARPVQHRAARHRCLMATPLALPETATRKFERLLVPTARASVPVGPPAPRQVGSTGWLVGKPRLELGQRFGKGGPSHLG